MKKYIYLVVFNDNTQYLTTNFNEIYDYYDNVYCKQYKLKPITKKNLQNKIINNKLTEMRNIIMFCKKIDIREYYSDVINDEMINELIDKCWIKYTKNKSETIKLAKNNLVDINDKMPNFDNFKQQFLQKLNKKLYNYFNDEINKIYNDNIDLVENMIKKNRVKSLEGFNIQELIASI